MNKKILITDGISSEAKKKLEEQFMVEDKKGLSPEKRYGSVQRNINRRNK